MFVRPHLDYGDAIFDQAYNKSFHESLESLQYNASLAIIRAIRGTSKQTLYLELGLEFPQHRLGFANSAFSSRFLQKHFFSYVIFEWNNLDKFIRNSESLSIF